MSKFSAIQQQLEQASGRRKTTSATSIESKASPEPVSQLAPQAAAYKAPSRHGKIHIGAYLHPDFKRSLRLVQAQTGDDIQKLIARSLNELFRVHNVPVIEDQD